MEEAAVSPPRDTPEDEEAQLLLAKKKRHRDRVAQEILSTERTYVQNLRTCIADYIVPLRESGICKADDVAKLVSVIELIVEVNARILDDLEATLADWSDESTLGDIFVRLGPFLKMYSQYCGNYHQAIDTAERLRQDSIFRQFEQEHPLPMVHLETYLIMPVQRIPRYSLLVEDFLLHTWTHHADYENLCQALKMILKIADFVNDSMHHSEKVNRVYELDLAFGGECKNLIQPSRRWIEDGVFMQLKKSMGISFSSNVRLHLFNDLLIVSQQLVSSYRFQRAIPLLELWVIPIVNDKAKHCLQLAGRQTLLLAAKSERQKWDWINLIRDTQKAWLDQQISDGYLDQRERLAVELGLDEPSLERDIERQFSMMEAEDEDEEESAFEVDTAHDEVELNEQEEDTLRRYGIITEQDQDEKRVMRVDDKNTVPVGHPGAGFAPFGGPPPVTQTSYDVDESEDEKQVTQFLAPDEEPEYEMEVMQPVPPISVTGRGLPPVAPAKPAYLSPRNMQTSYSAASKEATPLLGSSSTGVSSSKSRDCCILV